MRIPAYRLRSVRWRDVSGIPTDECLKEISDLLRQEVIKRLKMSEGFDENISNLTDDVLKLANAIDPNSDLLWSLRPVLRRRGRSAASGRNPVEVGMTLKFLLSLGQRIEWDDGRPAPYEDDEPMGYAGKMARTEAIALIARGYSQYPGRGKPMTVVQVRALLREHKEIIKSMSWDEGLNGPKPILKK